MGWFLFDIVEACQCIASRLQSLAGGQRRLSRSLVRSELLPVELLLPQLPTPDQHLGQYSRLAAVSPMTLARMS